MPFLSKEFHRCAGFVSDQPDRHHGKALRSPVQKLTWGRQMRENPLHLTPMIIFNKKVISKEQPQRQPQPPARGPTERPPQKARTIKLGVDVHLILAKDI
jgi:hypothetical protein